MADCPPTEKLRDFNEGRISDFAEVDRISNHLGRCIKCLRILDEMPSGALVEGLRTSSSDEMTIEEWELSESSNSFQDLITKIQTSSTDSTSYISLEQIAENHYEVVAAVGDGNFGRVVGAFANTADRVDKNFRAVKIPWSDKLISEGHQKQFFADCKKSETLVHPNILPILEHGHWDCRRVFYATPFVYGPSLSIFARSNPSLTREVLISATQQIASALEFAHGNGILHRHLNPNDIFLEKIADQTLPRIKVTDFGFTFDSRYQFELIEKSEAKNPFASPESRNSEARYIDERTDIYSLGKILKLLDRIASTGGETADEFDTHIGSIIKKSTVSRRRGRYQTVKEFMNDFQSCVDNYDV